MSVAGRRHRSRRELLVARLLGLALLGLPGCDVSDGEMIEDEDALGVLVERVTYHQDWVWGGAAPEDEGTGWSLTTDLGYEVHVERAWLTTYSVALVPCPEETDDGVMATLGEWLVPTAHAGHGGTLDASAMDEPFVEDLSTPETTTLGTVDFTEGRYCRVHLLAAAAPEDARAADPLDDPSGTTMVLEGWFRAPGSEDARELLVETSLANGTFLELPDGLQVDGALEITIHRRLDTLLDGIELDRDDPSEVERAVLLALMHGATLDVSAGSP